ncbi:MAG: ATP-binding protein [Dysgonamonadaceae bacterium]|jgi:DNA-binding NtrC family response regulator|nr:ATP-binding protein [Dysgonamonadaceae bacterium]
MSSKNLFYESEPNYRQLVIKRLIQYLKNPGRFSILLSGKRGTGKSHWLQQIYTDREDIEACDCFSTIHTVNGIIAKDYDENKWKEQFKKADNGLLVIDEVEEIGKSSQAILFEFLSTTDGQYGWETKEYNCRIVFTSTFEIKTLRDTEQYLSHKFYDRISQLVVQMPSFEDKNKNIEKDFETTWRKMNFPKKELPKDKFESWLKENSHKFHGNFRDLNKLAINWHNCKISSIDDDTTYEKVTKEFFEIYHFPKHNSENANAFYIGQESDNYKDNLNKFKMQYKEWLKEKYGSIRKGEKIAGISYRTMDGW